MVEGVQKSLRARVSVAHPGRTRSSSARAESNIRTFLEPSPVTHQDLLDAVKEASKLTLPFSNQSEAMAVYNDLKNKRKRSAKMLQVSVTMKPGTKCFSIRVDWDDNSTDIYDNPDVFHFGFHEWMNMVRILESKDQKSKFDKAWLGLLKKKIDSLVNVEQQLGITPSALSESDPAPKR